jgi:hypothetical protein
MGGVASSLMHPGPYCFTKELNSEELIDLRNKGTIRNPISSLSISVWVYSKELTGGPGCIKDEASPPCH